MDDFNERTLVDDWLDDEFGEGDDDDDPNELWWDDVELPPNAGSSS